MIIKDEKATLTIVKRIAQLLQEKGGRALLVGGCVRDAIMGITSKDYDLEVYNLTCDEIKNSLAGEFELDLVGMSFGVMKVKHFDIDIALPRTENKIGSGHRGFMVEMNPILTFTQAASRRDFTVNAIMQDPLTAEIIDPFGGINDINNKILQHVSSHFTEDPLRVLRGMQFVSRFNFTCAQDTLELCETLSQNELAKERIAQEWEKLLYKGNCISQGLKFLVDSKLIKFYPILYSFYQQSSLDNFVLWNQLLARLDNAILYRTGNLEDDLILMTSCLCADFSSIKDIKEFLSSIWNKTSILEYVPLFLENLQLAKALSCKSASDGKLRRLALKVKNPKLFLQVLKAIRFNNLEEVNALYNHFSRLNIHETSPVPIVQGRHLIAKGIKTGPQMGTLLKKCFEAQLDGVFDNLEDGLNYFEKLILLK